MSYWVYKDLDATGELIWERDIWNDSAVMSAWIWLAAYEQGMEWES